MFAKIRVLIIIMLLGLSVMTPYVAEANLINNGGFENGDFSGWTQSGNTGATGVESGTSHSGSYSAAFGPVGSDGFITQNIATTPGAQYTLDFWLQNDGGTPNDFSVNWAGQSVFAFANFDYFDWREYHYLVVAGGASTALQFEFRQDPRYFHLDDVSLELNSVPEPASMLLLGFGIIGLLGARRFKK
jgi:hypothetical protein